MVAECKQIFSARCAVCDSRHELSIVPSDVDRWKQGELIQDAMPYLSASERELLISGTCDDCWTEMFGGDEDFEE